MTSFQRSSALGNRTVEVVSLYSSGKTVSEIAEMYAVRPGTIINHLWTAVTAGRRLPAGDLLSLSELSPAGQQRVLQAFEAHGLEFLRPVYDALGETVSYDELHLLRLYLALSHQDG